MAHRALAAGSDRKPPAGPERSDGGRVRRRGGRERSLSSSFRSLEHETTGRVSIVELEGGARFVRLRTWRRRTARTPRQPDRPAALRRLGRVGRWSLRRPGGLEGQHRRRELWDPRRRRPRRVPDNGDLVPALHGRGWRRADLGAGTLQGRLPRASRSSLARAGSCGTVTSAGRQSRAGCGRHASKRRHPVSMPRGRRTPRGPWSRCPTS